MASIMAGFYIVRFYYAHYTALPIYPETLTPYLSAGLSFAALWLPITLIVGLGKRLDRWYVPLIMVVFVASVVGTGLMYGGYCLTNRCWLDDVPDHAVLILDKPISQSGFPLTADANNPMQTTKVRVLAKTASGIVIVDEQTGVAMQINQGVITQLIPVS